MGCSTGLSDTSGACGAPVLWSNMLHLISLKPWTGWGGELSYAHYITLFPEERFLRAAGQRHNLPCTWRWNGPARRAAAVRRRAGVAGVWSRLARDRPCASHSWGVVAVGAAPAPNTRCGTALQVTTLFALVLLCWRRAPGRGCARRGGGWAASWAMSLWGWGLGAAVPDRRRSAGHGCSPVPGGEPALEAGWPSAARLARCAGRAPAQGVLFSDQGALCLAHAGFDARQCGPDARRGAGFAAFFARTPGDRRRWWTAPLALGRADKRLYQRRYRIAYPNDFARWQARRQCRQRSQPTRCAVAAVRPAAESA